MLTYLIKDQGKKLKDASKDFIFAASVASFGMILRDSKYKGSMTFDFVLELAEESIGKDKGGYKTEFIELVKKAKGIVK